MFRIGQSAGNQILEKRVGTSETTRGIDFMKIEFKDIVRSIMKIIVY